MRAANIEDGDSLGPSSIITTAGRKRLRRTIPAPRRLDYAVRRAPPGRSRAAVEAIATPSERASSPSFRARNNASLWTGETQPSLQLPQIAHPSLIRLFLNHLRPRSTAQAPTCASSSSGLPNRYTWEPLWRYAAVCVPGAEASAAEAVSGRRPSEREGTTTRPHKSVAPSSGSLQSTGWRRSYEQTHARQHLHPGDTK